METGLILPSNRITYTNNWLATAAEWLLASPDSKYTVTVDNGAVLRRVNSEPNGWVTAGRILAFIIPIIPVVALIIKGINRNNYVAQLEMGENLQHLTSNIAKYTQRKLNRFSFTTKGSPPLYSSALAFLENHKQKIIIKKGYAPNPSKFNTLPSNCWHDYYYSYNTFEGIRRWHVDCGIRGGIDREPYYDDCIQKIDHLINICREKLGVDSAIEEPVAVKAELDPNFIPNTVQNPPVDCLLEELPVAVLIDR